MLNGMGRAVYHHPHPKREVKLTKTRATGALRAVIALLLLPFCVGASRTLFSLLQAIRPSSPEMIPPSAWALAGGFVLWNLVFFTLPRPVRTYVLAHELTHALWAWVMGARVSGLRISKAGGSITLTKTNVWITLAPYFFPLYTVLVIAGYYVLSIFLDVERYGLLWLALVGLTWGFHLTFTITTLMQQQKDVTLYGRMFSYMVIYLLNTLGIGLWVVMVSSATLEEMMTFLEHDIRDEFMLVRDGVLLLSEAVAGWTADLRALGARR
jgi:hypothetical protein